MSRRTPSGSRLSFHRCPSAMQASSASMRSGSLGSETDPNRVQAHFELETKQAAQSFAKELANQGYDVHQTGSSVFLFADDSAAARELGNTLKTRPGQGAAVLRGEGRTFFV